MNEYGKISDNAYKKYNAELCIVGEFTKDNIDKFKNFYREVKGVPRFIHEILHINPNSLNCYQFYKNPNLIEWNVNGDILIIPNLPHFSDHNELLINPKKCKDNLYGLSLVAWYIHPKLLTETNFIDPLIRHDFSNLSLSFDYFLNSEWLSTTSKHPSQIKIKEIEDSSEIPYLSSVFSLTKANIDWLKNVKHLSIDYLKRVYGVTNDDLIRLYFHDIYSEKLTTLHMHIRVNQGIHPHEWKQLSELDEIIEFLESGNTIEEFFIKKNKFYLDLKEYDEVMNSVGVSVTIINNPFVLNDQWLINK